MWRRELDSPKRYLDPLCLPSLLGQDCRPGSITISQRRHGQALECQWLWGSSLTDPFCLCLANAKDLKVETTKPSLLGLKPQRISVRMLVAPFDYLR